MKSQEMQFSVKFPEEAVKDWDFKMVCTKCGMMINIPTQRTTFNVPFKAKDGQTILLTYFDCPGCGIRHYVQIDTKQTSELRKSVSMLWLRIAKQRKNGNTPPQGQRNKFDRQKKSLLSLRRRLMEQYEGSIVTNTLTGEELELHFTKC